MDHRRQGQKQRGFEVTPKDGRIARSQNEAVFQTNQPNTLNESNLISDRNAKECAK